MGTSILINDREFEGEIVFNEGDELTILFVRRYGLHEALTHTLHDTRNSVLRLTLNGRTFMQPARLGGFAPTEKGIETMWVKTASPTFLGV